MSQIVVPQVKCLLVCTLVATGGTGKRLHYTCGENQGVKTEYIFLMGWRKLRMGLKQLIYPLFQCWILVNWNQEHWKCHITGI